MKLAKPAGVLLIAAIVVACAQTPKPTPQPEQPVADTQPLVVPKREPGIVTDGRDIAAAQRTLNQLGYNAGKTDGIVGPNTGQAIRTFQKDRGLVEDGRLTLALADKLKAETSIVVRSGDLLVYSDGETELVAVERQVHWNEGDTHSLVAIRPSMAGWPTAARTGLDWAVSHALDNPASPVKWSSTGVGQNFEIYASELKPGEAALAGSDAQSCRHFESARMSGSRAIPQSPAATARGGGTYHTAQSGWRDRQRDLGLLLRLSDDRTCFWTRRFDRREVLLGDVISRFRWNAALGEDRRPFAIKVKASARVP